MNENSTPEDPARELYGPSVQYADGTVLIGQPLDINDILAAFERLEVELRSAFLCIFAHDLTVAIRAILSDAPLSEVDLDRVKQLNECLHQLTSCVNPLKRWPRRDQVLLLRTIIEDSFTYGLDRWIGPALALAAGNIIAAERPIVAK
jgi:hypothetical protein